MLGRCASFHKDSFVIASQSYRYEFEVLDCQINSSLSHICPSGSKDTRAIISVLLGDIRGKFGIKSKQSFLIFGRRDYLFTPAIHRSSCDSVRTRDVHSTFVRSWIKSLTQDATDGESFAKGSTGERDLCRQL